MAASQKTALAIVFLLLSMSASAFDGADYGHRFSGDGTYYGGNPFTGNCAMRAPLPSFYKNFLAVAINDPQYKYACGACLRLWGEGKGLGAKPIKGPINAYVADRCAECKHGDLDLSSVGDGRWKISWELVPCPGETRIQFQFEGSNSHFWKFQPRGMRSPATSVIVNGKPCKFMQDNHWVATFAGGVKGEAKVEVLTTLGEHITSYVSRWNGVVHGGVIGGGNTAQGGSQRDGRAGNVAKNGGGSPQQQGRQRGKSRCGWTGGQ